MAGTGQEASAPAKNERLVTIRDARDCARSRWPELVYSFVDGAAGYETGARMATDAIETLRLQPRGMIDVETRDLSTTILGQSFALPFGVAPMGMCELAWAGTDAMLAGLAKQRKLPLGVSTASSTSITDLYDQSEGNAWFQLYPVADDALTDKIIDLARDSGCEVMLVTIDVPTLSWRPRELRTSYNVPFRFGPRQLIDFALHPHWSLTRLAAGIPELANLAAVRPGKFERTAMRGRVTHEFVKRLRDRWNGKLVIKGVMCVEDALISRDAGADAIYVSGHGARQLDGLPPPIYQLAAIRDALGRDFPLIYDTAIRSGEDIVKAIAVGADFVMLGRPFLYAIGADGERGLHTICSNLADEVSIVMAQIGKRRIQDIDRGVLARWQTDQCPKSLGGRANL